MMMMSVIDDDDHNKNDKKRGAKSTTSTKIVVGFEGRPWPTFFPVASNVAVDNADGDE